MESSISLIVMGLSQKILSSVKIFLDSFKKEKRRMLIVLSNLKCITYGKT